MKCDFNSGSSPIMSEFVKDVMNSVMLSHDVIMC
jgi:hypothetical protein